MFGYIRAVKEELKVKDYELYKAVYCSLCRKLGKDYGVFARFTLSYDFTFLALLEMSLSEGCTKFERKVCPFNPLKKCNYCKEDENLGMSSAAAMIMLHYKIEDNLSDEKGFKKLKYLFLKPIFSPAYKKAKRLYPNIEEIVSDYITKQKALEKACCQSLDEAADPSALMMSKLLQFCSKDTTQKRILERLGYCIGRYIYLLDAACDLEEDIKNKSYNVLSFGLEGEVKEYAKTRVSPQLYFCANEAAKAFELLDIKKHKDILGNIIYLGLEDTFMKELNK